MKNDYSLVIEKLRAFGPMSDELEQAIRASLKTKTLRANGFWVQPSQIADSIAFLASGVLVAYHPEDEDRKILNWLMPENNIVISVASFFSRQPATEYIKAVEDSVLYYITYTELQNLYERFVAFNMIGRRITEHYYMLSEQRLLFLKRYSAEQRVVLFMETQPELYRRIAGKLVAEYLHISHAEFYKVRSKINKKRKN